MKRDWSSAGDKAFEGSKTALKNANFLAHFDPSKPLMVECDASHYGIGLVLSIKVGGEYRPIRFRSSNLSVAERKYAHLEKEELALVFGVTKFRQYLLGRNFTLVTITSRLMTSFVQIGQFHQWPQLEYNDGRCYYDLFHTLMYRKGTGNLNADAFSRLQCPAEADSSTEELPEYVLLIEQLDENFVSPADL